MLRAKGLSDVKAGFAATRGVDGCRFPGFVRQTLDENSILVRAGATSCRAKRARDDRTTGGSEGGGWGGVRHALGATDHRQTLDDTGHRRVG